MRRALVAAALVFPMVIVGLGPRAGAAGLEDLRARAQSLADRVSSLEHELADLNVNRVALQDEIARSSARIGILELELSQAREGFDAAMDRYVQRAVDLYKGTDDVHLALLLSAQDLDDMFTALEAARYSASQDVQALDEVAAARADAEAAQANIDERKQKLLAAEVRVSELTVAVEQTLTSRGEVLAALTAEIAEIERAARRAAALAARPDQAFLKLLRPAGPAPGIPDGFVGTGVSFEGIASWYGPGFEGNHTASGDIFDPDLFTAASKELPLGTWLYVTYGGRGVVVLVNDRGPYVDDRVLDLSRAAAESLGITGLGWIEAEILLKAKR